LRLIVTGIVQGVGFRPFVHRIALKSGVKGYVRNIGGAEVEIVIEGDSSSIRDFIRRLLFESPPPAFIDEIEVFEERVKGYRDFRILRSIENRQKYSMIPPDFAICDDCLKEVLDPMDRRYRYPFNSCAWCGPRFSMMYTIPYDRENTAMKKYELCDECRKEYTDVNNVRRYHAQGISCPKDGPRLWLTDNKGEAIDTKDPIKEAAKLIDEGYIVAVKGLGGYHLAALATDDDTVLKLRERKKRPRKPFAVMVLDTSVAEKLVYLNDQAINLLNSPIRPIVLLPKRPDTPVSKYVSPGMAFEGVFTPYTALHYLLLSETKDKFLIMTSGNVKGKPMCIDEACAYTELASIADYFLVHDREIVNRVDDSVVRFTCNEPVILRRSRGYAPLWIKLPDKLKYNVIAFGADLQNSGAIAFDDKVVLTQFIGDLDNVETLNDLDRYLKYFIKNYGINIDESIIVVDKHPGYNSRKLGVYYAKEYGTRLIEVQHHYAHLLATIIDRKISGRIVGVALDGTGYGDDEMIWGGEILFIDTFNNTYKRIGHLEYQPLDSERSIYYPIRFFISVLSRILDWDELWRIISRFKLYNRVPGKETELKLVIEKIKRGFYVNTSSTGRFLDGVSAFLNISAHRSFDGEPAIMLESKAFNGKYLGNEIFMPKVINNSGTIIIETTSVYLELVDYFEKYRVEDIAYTIQYNLGYALGEAIKHYLRGRKALSKVPLGGGAAVNNFIVKGIRDSLKEDDIEVYLPRRIPVNDGGIALGQVASVFFSKELD